MSLELSTVYSCDICQENQKIVISGNYLIKLIGLKQMKLHKCSSPLEK